MSPDLGPVNAAADPCADFATYACAANTGRPTRPSDLFAWRQPATLRFLDELAAGRNADASNEAKVVREFYRRCKSVDSRNAGLAKLRNKLVEISRIQTLSDFANLLGTLRVSGTSVLVELRVGRLARSDSGLTVAQIGLAISQLTRPSDPAPPHLTAEHAAHWQRLAAVSGVISPEEVDAAVRIDNWLEAARSSDERDDGPETSVDTRGRDELVTRRFPWNAYFHGLGAARTLALIPARPGVLKRIDGLVDLPLADLKNYVRVLLVERNGEYLSEAFLAEEQRFHIEVTTAGKGRAGTLTQVCGRLAVHDLETLVAELYLSELAEPDAEVLARQLFGILRTHLAQTVENAEWLDPASRQAALAKVHSIGILFIGDTEAKTPTISLAPGSFLDAYTQLLDANGAAELAMVGKPTDRAVPPQPFLHVGSYSGILNSIWLSPEIVRPPYIRTDGFSPFHIGALGTIIGHELAHALSPLGRRSDAKGSYRETWSKETVAVFEKRTGCLARNHIAKDPAGGTKVNDRSTINEDVADLVGVQIALRSLDASARRQGMTGDVLRSTRQEFFLSYAQQVCLFGSDVPELRSPYDPHSPRKVRINQVVANIPTFAETFACRAGAPMAPRQRCAIW